jgi:hypothetical protein
VIGIGLANAHLGEMKRPQKRPKHLDPTRPLSKSPPVPKPEQIGADEGPAGESERLDPTRYGDWEKKGIAVDF